MSVVPCRRVDTALILLDSMDVPASRPLSFSFHPHEPKVGGRHVPGRMQSIIEIDLNMNLDEVCVRDA